MLRPLKMLKWLLITLVVLIVIALAIVTWSVDSAAKYAVEVGGERAAGQKTTASGAHVSLLSGDVGVNEIGIANLSGYEAKHIMATESVDVGVEYGSLFGDTVRLRGIEIDGLEIHIQQKGLKNNVSELLDQIKRLAGQGAEADGRRKYLVDRIVIRDVTAHVQVLPVGGQATALKVTIPQITMDNVTKENARPILMSELFARVIPAVLAAVLEKGDDIIPADLSVLIGKDLAGAVGALGQDAADLVSQTTDHLTATLLKDLPPAAGEAVKEIGVQAGEKLKDILGGEKKPQQ